MIRKCIGWILGELCDINVWPHPWPWPLNFSRSSLKIAVSQQLFSDWCETKRKQINSILGCLYGLALWPHPWPWPWSFKVLKWPYLRNGGELINMERKGCESIIHAHDLWVTKVGRVDVPYSDWGEFRRWRAIDISSCVWNWSSTMDILSALWILMAWHFSNRTSLTTQMSLHPLISSCLWVNTIFQLTLSNAFSWMKTV